MFFQVVNDFASRHFDSMIDDVIFNFLLHIIV
jgi:hypothetical protein